MKNLFLLIIAICILSISACSRSSSDINKIDQTRSYIKVSMNFNTESYPRFGVKMYPQIAVWAQEKSTGFIKTVYVTEKGAKSDWISAKERPDAMPVWYGMVKKEKKSGAAGVDSVTSATPSGENFTAYMQIPESLNAKKIELYLEANVSFDYNDYYKKDLGQDSPAFSGVNGQPSVIWMSEISLSGPDKDYAPRIIGAGHVLGRDNIINKDISHITTAKGLFHKITFSHVAGKAGK